MRMQYSETLRDHFENPRNIGRLEESPATGSAVVGRRETGGILALHIRVDQQGLITEARFQAYGPPALIAAGSWLTENINGFSFAHAESISQHAVVEALDLPPVRIYCAMLAEDAIRAATQNFKDKQRAFV